MCGGVRSWVMGAWVETNGLRPRPATLAARSSIRALQPITLHLPPLAAGVPNLTDRTLPPLLAQESETTLAQECEMSLSCICP